MLMQRKHSKKNMIIFLLISLILSLFMQICVINISNEKNMFNSEDAISILNKIKIAGYDVKKDAFLALNNDPQLLFEHINSNVSAVEINFSEDLDYDIPIQIYFPGDRGNLSEQNSVIYNAKKGENEAVIEIPYNNYSMIRIDIGNNIDQGFKLADVKIYSNKISSLSKALNKVNLPNTFIWVFIICILLYLITKYRVKLFNRENKVLETIFLAFCFIMYTLWAIIQPYNSCPDEAMRYDVIKYVFTYNSLPHGGDPLIINKIWGFSYAFLPYLSGLVSVVFMKLASIFTFNQQILILAARMAVVCFATVTVFYIIKIANKCFEDEYKWLFTILVSCLPQFVFLGSYMNNDMLAFMSVAMMVYYLLEGHEKNWDIKRNVGLAISVSICLLSYYNAYPFILFSIGFFIWSNINNNVDKYIIFRKFMFVFIIVFILTGWWFIRNGIIYNGDFLGLKTTRQYSNMYARDDIKPINHITPLKQGYSIMYMLFNMGWIKSTYLSFIGVFGYMNIKIYNWMYIFYTVIILIGLIHFIIKVLNSRKQKNYVYVFYLFMGLAGLINILLSVYQSYTAGFQPQGRYIIQCLIPLMIFVTTGLRYMFNFMENRFNIKSRNWIVTICILSVLISILCFSRILIPVYILM